LFNIYIYFNGNAHRKSHTLLYYEKFENNIMKWAQVSNTTRQTCGYVNRILFFIGIFRTKPFFISVYILNRGQTLYTHYFYYSYLSYILFSYLYSVAFMYIICIIIWYITATWEHWLNIVQNLNRKNIF